MAYPYVLPVGRNNKIDLIPYNKNNLGMRHYFVKKICSLGKGFKAVFNI